MPSVSLIDLQVNLVVKTLFILVADHDRNLSVVHNLLEVKEPFMPHAGPEDPIAAALFSSGRSTLEQEFPRLLGTSTCQTTTHVLRPCHTIRHAHDFMFPVMFFI